MITGANRGIGLEFARQYAEQGWRVIATCRRPEAADALAEIVRTCRRVAVEPLDVTDPGSIENLAAACAGAPIDVLLNNAGILGGSFADQRFGRVDDRAFRRAMAVNALGPLRMAEAFAPHVIASGQKKIVNITSAMGSIEDAASGGLSRRVTGGLFNYRASKSALNMMMRTVAVDLRARGVIVSLIHPGPVNTDIVGMIPGFVRALVLMSPEAAVRRMIALIDTLTLERSGAYLRADGSVIPW